MPQAKTDPNDTFHGKAQVNLAAVADARRYKADGTFVLPPYDGSYGAQLQAIPAGLFDPRMPVAGEFRWVSQWVDERTYARRRADPAKSWATPDARNGVRDWLEKKAWDTYTDTPDDGTGQLDAGRSTLTAVWENCSQSYAGMVSPTTPWLVTFNPLTPQLRHPEEPYWWKFYYGFYEKDPPDGFPAIALHESRHSWQFTLSSRGGVDSDGDFLFAPGSIPAASAELLDAPNIAAPGGANGDGHFKGDGPGLTDTGDAVRTMREHEAMRFTLRDLLAQEVSCALSSFTIVSGDAQTGAPSQPLPQPLVVKVLAQNSDATGAIFNTARAGTTVKFAVLTGNATVNGGSEAFAMTDDSGQASMAVVNGTSDSQIQALLLPPMAPQNSCGSRGADGILSQPLAAVLTFTIHAR